MKYDVIIMGGGISGLVCGIRCAGAGLKTAVISGGASALHFSSGCIDLLGRHPKGQIVRAPYEALDDFISKHPGHPFARTGIQAIGEALAFFRSQTAAQGLEYASNGVGNHFHVTPLGTLKPTYLSPKGVFSEKVRGMFEKKGNILILNFEGYRDFSPRLAAANLAAHPLYTDCRIFTGVVSLPESIKAPGLQMRSIDIARLFEKPQHLENIAQEIRLKAKEVEFVALPAFLGIEHAGEVLEELQEKTGRIIYEVPTLPPSILGMRLDFALKSRFAALGGVLISGDKVVSGTVENHRVVSVCTQNNGETRLKARWFVLATGSFFSGGLKSDASTISEPVFNLAVEASLPRSTWRGAAFFDPESHPFLSFGVRTNEKLHPYDASSALVENLFCAGAVLAHYNPVAEGTGGGVAVTTGHCVAGRIISAMNRQAVSAT